MGLTVRLKFAKSRFYHHIQMFCLLTLILESVTLKLGSETLILGSDNGNSGKNLILNVFQSKF